VDSRLGVVSNATLGHYRQTGSGAIAWIRLKLQNPQGGRKSTQPTDGIDTESHVDFSQKCKSGCQGRFEDDLRSDLRRLPYSQRLRGRLRKKDFELGRRDFGCQEPDSELRFSLRVFEQRKKKG
jgi:hypothetical protein